MTIEDVMTKEVITVDMDTSLKKIHNIFNDKNLHHVIVLENEKIIGIISDRDMFKALSPFLNTAAEQNRDLNTLKRRAHQIMTRNVTTISKKASLKSTIELVLQKNISCLPVVTPDGQIEGIITWKDLLKAYLILS